MRDPSLGWIEGIETDDGTVLLTFFVSCHKTPDYSAMRLQHNEWWNESKAHWTLHTHSKFQQIPNVNVVVGMRLNYYGTFSMQFMVGWDWPHQTLKTEVCASKTAKIQTRWKWMCIKSPHSTSSILLLCRPTLQCSMKSGDKGRWRDEKQVLTVFLRRLFVRLRIPLRQAL